MSVKGSRDECWQDRDEAFPHYQLLIASILKNRHTGHSRLENGVPHEQKSLAIVHGNCAWQNQVQLRCAWAFSGLPVAAALHSTKGNVPHRCHVPTGILFDVLSCIRIPLAFSLQAKLSGEKSALVAMVKKLNRDVAKVGQCAAWGQLTTHSCFMECERILSSTEAKIAGSCGVVQRSVPCSHPELALRSSRTGKLAGETASFLCDISLFDHLLRAAAVRVTRVAYSKRLSSDSSRTDRQVTQTCHVILPVSDEEKIFP